MMAVAMGSKGAIVCSCHMIGSGVLPTIEKQRERQKEKKVKRPGPRTEEYGTARLG